MNAVFTLTGYFQSVNKTSTKKNNTKTKKWVQKEMYRI